MSLRLDDELISSFEASGPSDEREIVDAERVLDLKFPSEYREFLSRFGAVLGKGYEIAGLTHANLDDLPLWRNVVLDTQILRRSHHGSDPVFSGLVPISSNGMDVTFYLRTAPGWAGSIVALGPGTETEVAANLSEFITKLHAGELRY